MRIPGNAEAPITEYMLIDGKPVDGADRIEAIVRANKTQFGLSGSVWGRDTEKALAVPRNIQAREVWVNTHGVLAINHLALWGPQAKWHRSQVRRRGHSGIRPEPDHHDVRARVKGCIKSFVGQT
jgi:Aldehyde dehydrogenase family